MAADRNYLQHLMVTMESVIAASHRDTELDFLILSDGSITGNMMNTLEESGRISITVINAAELVGKYMEVNPSCSWPLAVYYRLLLPFLCKQDSRIIYLDCDVIVRKPLDELWNLSMDGCFVAGVADHGFDHRARLEKSDVRIEGEYLNSGVMVWDLDRIRSDGYEQRLADVSKRLTEPEFPDQDWINMMFDSGKILLSFKWNCMSHIFESVELEEPHLSTESMNTAIRDPAICHFTNVKPWTMSYTVHPFWFEYWEHLRKTRYAFRYPYGVIKKICLSSPRSPVYRLVRKVKG